MGFLARASALFVGDAGRNCVFAARNCNVELSSNPAAATSATIANGRASKVGNVLRPGAKLKA